MASKSRSRRSRKVAASRRRVTREQQVENFVASVPPARVGSVIAPPLVTLHNYRNGSRLFINGTEQMKLWADGANHTTINTVAALLTELQRLGVVSVVAADFRELSTEL